MNNIISKLNVKRLSDILGSLIDYTGTHTTEVSDFTPGSIIRSIYEAIAMEVEQLYILSTENVLWGIDHGVIDAFNYIPKEAVASYGYVTITLYTPLGTNVQLSRGTTFYSSLQGQSLSFSTQQAYSISKGTSVFQVPVYANQVGSVGNIAAHYIDTISTSQLSVSKVDNEGAFLTGCDEETADELKKRFREYISTLGRATDKAVVYAAKTVSEVTGAFIDENVGEFTVYAHDANGDLNDATLTKVENAVDQYRPAGIPWKVSPMTKEALNIDIDIAVTDENLANNAFVNALTLYIKDYLNHFEAGDDLVPAKLSSKILGYSSLIIDVGYPDGATYTTTPEQIIRAGEINVFVISQKNFNGANATTPDDDDDTTPSDNGTADGGGAS